MKNFLNAVLILFFAVPPVSAAELSRDFINEVADEVRLSPDGQYVAASIKDVVAGDAHNLVTMRLSDSVAQAITGYSDIDVQKFFWANDQRLVFSVAHKTGVMQSPEYKGSFTILRDGSGGKKLADRRQKAGVAAPQLLHRLPTDWTGVLIQRASSTALFPEVYQLDVESGRTKLVVARQLGVTQWIADNLGVVRAALDKGEDVLDGQQRLLYRDTPDAAWNPISTFSADNMSVLGFEAGNRRLIVVALAPNGVNALRYMSLQGELEEPILFDPVYDIVNLSGGAVGLKQSDQGRIIYYQYMADQVQTVYFDSRWEARQTIIDESLVDSTNTIVGWSDDERVLLVTAQGPQSSRDYYLFDTTQQKLRFLQPPSQWVK